MKSLIVAAAMLAAGQAFSQQTVNIQIPVEKALKCQAEGGCVLITRSELDAILEKVADDVKKEVEQDCRNRT